MTDEEIIRSWDATLDRMMARVRDKHRRLGLPMCGIETPGGPIVWRKWDEPLGMWIPCNPPEYAR